MQNPSDKYIATRDYLTQWQSTIQKNPFDHDTDFQHSVAMYLNDPHLTKELHEFGEKIVKELEPLVAENNLRFNWPRLEKYNGIGECIEYVVHHPNYVAAGNIIYGSKMLARLATPGGLLESLAFFFLSGHAGEAGHNCPFACSAGIVRVLQKVDNVPQCDEYIDKLCLPSYSDNYTGAQFLTELQGGSDVGQNACEAKQDEEGNWRITGEKWFCSNANADLILMTARYQDVPGTRGLALFLVPKRVDHHHNHFSIRRLKEKIGTCSMASGEIDFQGAIAYPVGELENGFRLVMENVLHLSRLCNTFCMLGMGRRAYHVAKAYAEYRIAFGQPIINYPLVQENLAIIKSESDAMLASIFATTALQDQIDQQEENAAEQDKLLLRLLANLNKYISALWSVEHIHHSIDILAGNGAIETFSPLPRLLKDSIVCENWEGTHNTLRMQILRDIQKYHVDELLLQHIETHLERVDDEIRKAKIEAYMEVARARLIEFKNADFILQSLLIKNIVDDLVKCYLASMLLVEALDQEERHHNNQKMHSFDFFVRRHLLLQPDVIDMDYLKQAQTIVNL